MKRFLSILIVIVLALAGASGESANASYSSGPYQYSVADDGTACITGFFVGFLGPAARAVLPSELDGHPVTAIGSYAFSSQNSLSSVVIPDSVTLIGPNAFQNCRYLKSVTISASVGSLPARAFYNCIHGVSQGICHHVADGTANASHRA